MIEPRGLPPRGGLGSVRVVPPSSASPKSVRFKVTFDRARSNADEVSRVRDRPASGNVGGEDVLLARRRWPRERAAQVPVPHAKCLAAAAIHSSRPSMGMA